MELDGKGLPEALRGLWRRMLEGPFGAVLLPVEVEGGLVSLGLVASPEGVERSRAMAPYMGVNGARVLQMMTKVSPSSRPVAAVLRPCEVRAAVELRKLQQVAEENLFLVALDCLGTYPLEEYRQRLEQGVPEEPEPEEVRLREACRVCLWPVAPWADLRVGFLGLEGRVVLEALTEEGEEALRQMGLEIEELDLDEREARIEEVLKGRKAAEGELLELQQRELKGHEAILGALSACIKCLNCMTVCPLCYCKECFFNSPTFEMEADRFLRLASSRPALRMPSEVLLFHLTRMAHMGTSCVACGMCQEGCPQEVPVFRLFKAVSKRLQGIFDYEPGRDPEEPLPLATFREEELKEVEEPKI